MHRSPLLIDVMLYHYSSPVPYHTDSSAYQAAMNDLQSEGLLTCDDNDPNLIRSTEKGRMWVQMIVSTPLPDPAWIHPTTKEVITWP